MGSARSGIPPPPATPQRWTIRSSLAPGTRVRLPWRNEIRHQRAARCMNRSSTARGMKATRLRSPGVSSGLFPPGVPRVVGGTFGVKERTPSGPAARSMCHCPPPPCKETVHDHDPIRAIRACLRPRFRPLPPPPDAPPRRHRARRDRGLLGAAPTVRAQEAPSTAIFQGETYVGTASDPTLFVAIVLGDGEARGYLCKTPIHLPGGINAWLTGPFIGDTLDLTSESGATLTGQFAHGAVSGAPLSDVRSRVSPVNGPVSQALIPPGRWIGVLHR